MTPSARVAAAIDVLERWRQSGSGLDRLLSAWGRDSRYAGAKDRRAVADLCYDALRRWRSAAWAAGLPEGARAALIGILRLDGVDPEELFTGERHAPSRLTSGERMPRSLADAPRAVRLDIPDWLQPELEGVPDRALLALRERAPVDLRVNLLKTDRNRALERLSVEGIEAVPGPLSPTCLRVAPGTRGVTGTEAFREGLVELQDAASQAVADFAGARPGETVLDFCAGGGGKSLAMAAAMGGHGRIAAHDAAPERLKQLPPRAERAGARVDMLPPDGWRELKGQADLTLVDAPCSGSGAWRRNPDAKWRLDPELLANLLATQAGILDDAALTVRPGGRLVYATCSLLPRENGFQVERFLARHAEFFREAAPLALSPLDGGDGFFAARLRRRG